MPGCCPCCYNCLPTSTVSADDAAPPGCPSPFDRVLIPCCEVCPPCLLCVEVISETCQGPCYGPTARNYLRFHSCYYDAVLNEEVFQWKAVSSVGQYPWLCGSYDAVTHLFSGWEIHQIFFQCRIHRESRLTRMVFKSPSRTYCVRDGVIIDELLDVAWFTTRSQCVPLIVEATAPLVPGLVGCPGCFLQLRAKECVCGCEPPAQPSVLRATVIGVEADPGPLDPACAAVGIIGKTWLMTRSATAPPGWAPGFGLGAAACPTPCYYSPVTPVQFFPGTAGEFWCVMYCQPLLPVDGLPHYNLAGWGCTSGAAPIELGSYCGPPFQATYRLSMYACCSAAWPPGQNMDLIIEVLP